GRLGARSEQQRKREDGDNEPKGPIGRLSQAWPPECELLSDLLRHEHSSFKSEIRLPSHASEGRESAHGAYPYRRSFPSDLSVRDGPESRAGMGFRFRKRAVGAGSRLPSCEGSGAEPEPVIEAAPGLTVRLLGPHHLEGR